MAVRFFVVLLPVRDLLLVAKHLFVAARTELQAITRRARSARWPTWRLVSVTAGVMGAFLACALRPFGQLPACVVATRATGGLDVLVQDGGVPIAHGCRLTCSDEQALGCQRCKCSALDARGSINAQSVKFWPVQNNKIDGSDLDRNNYSKMLRHRAILLK
jgi:hypothetical protein